MSNDPRGQVHRTLRTATVAAHHALDHHRLLRRLTGPDLTREQYAESLAAMSLPHARLERLVHLSRHHAETRLELAPRFALLEADLTELSWPVPAVCQFPADTLDARAAWWGQVYVLEGSRRGGAFIGRCIQSSLGDTVPCHFFSGSTGNDSGDALFARLEYELKDPEALEHAAASARAAFATFKADLDAFEDSPQRRK